MHRNPLLSFTILAASYFLLATSCTPQEISSGREPATLIPFVTSTRTAETRPTPEGLVAVETALPSPTPSIYTVKRGDTISSIAANFGVSINDLQAANPDVSPNAMSVGQALKIPGSPQNLSGEPTPTPVPFTVQQIECYPTLERGMWCFVLVHNDFPDFIENVSAQVTLVGPDQSVLGSQTALLPLDILPPNTSLPLAVFFSPEILPEAKARVQILTAIRLLPDDERYLPATVSNTLVQVAAEGHSAQVSGRVLLPEKAKAARQVWVTGSAYDEAGRVVGVRRWEWSAGLAPGGSLPFDFMVASLGGRIVRVDFAVEARP